MGQASQYDTGINLLCCLCSVSLHASPSMSSANVKLVSCLPPMLTVPTCPSNAYVMIRSKKTLNSMGYSRNHYLTPTLVFNHSPIDSLWKASLVALLYKEYYEEEVQPYWKTDYKPIIYTYFSRIQNRLS